MKPQEKQAYACDMSTAAGSASGLLSRHGSDTLVRLRVGPTVARMTGFEGMPRSAVQGAAGPGAIAKAAALGVALLLAACGGSTPDKQTAAKGGGADAGATTSIAGGGGPVAQPTGAPAALDTTTWVLAPPFYAGGDEPAWKLDVGDGWFSFKRSGLPKIETQIVAPKKVNGADVFGFELTRSVTGEGPNRTAIAVPIRLLQPCSCDR